MKRFDILSSMIQEHGWTLGAEVGTGGGKTAQELLRRNKGLSLIEVAHYPGPQSLPSDHIDLCTTQRSKRLWLTRTRPYRTRMKILEMSSRKAAKQVEDGSLDFVFIDADHTYPHCSQDIQLWDPKVKTGGLVMGHDYSLDWPGVVQAVDEAYPVGDRYFGKDRTWWTWKS